MKPFVLSILVCLTACKEISFQEPQPKGKNALTKIPAELHGRYLLSDPGNPATDTLFVYAEGYRVGHNPKEKNNLSDSLILKYYKGYYFLNINSNPEWLLRVVRPEGNGDLLYLSLEEQNDDFSAFVKKLSRAIQVDSVQLKDEKLYQIDPTAKQLVSLINKGYFKKTILKKIH